MQGAEDKGPVPALLIRPPRPHTVQCTGEQPCGSCVKRGTECVVNEDSDLRRRKAVKRKIEDLEHDRDLLLHLVATFREARNRPVIQLLNLIRSNASLEEIRLYIDDQLGREELAQTPELEDVRVEIRRLVQSNTHSRRRVLDVNRLADTPVYNVPAKPWTRLSDDDSFVSHLVSLWFTWYHPIFNCIDRDLFMYASREYRLPLLLAVPGEYYSCRCMCQF